MIAQLKSLIALEERPQFGGKGFPWEEFEQKLSTLFQKEVKLSHFERGWRATDTLFEGMQESHFIYSLAIAPLKSPVFVAVNTYDLQLLMEQLLGGNEAEALFIDKESLTGFYNYLGVQFLNLIEQSDFLEKEYPLRLVETPFAPQECFVVDVLVHFGTLNSTFRVLLPKAFRREWKLFESLSSFKGGDDFSKEIPIPLSFVAGSASLTLSEWKSVNLGDFILIDRSSFDLKKRQGGVVVELFGRPFFRGKYKLGKVKLSEYPFYEEPMMENEMDEEEDLLESIQEEVSDESDGSARKKVLEKAEEIPLELSVEIAKLNLSLKELSTLSVGSVLELDVEANTGVDLLIRGKKVARGELVEIGEALGVRILEV